ncbi:cytochrome c oxidase assembly factor 7-like [Anneissia japonica]|uniref:cytochrome c oxidase assembly factor 7-like n=1 Tax=Anneissia japonica TaxID=1529436 RepID=UPI0014259723|nr:cytochrome c oxidase assembly factor 7-like [Anneissia japonica]
MNQIDFKNESEVKEYIQNLGTEYSYQCYAEKSPEGCYRLGDFFAAVKGDFTKAAEAYKKSCEDYGFAKACNKVGALYMHGKGVDTNIEEAFKFFDKGCSGGCADACHGAGILLHQVGLGSDKRKDAPRAVSYLEGSCNQGHIASCFHLSSIYIKGAEGVKKDFSKSYELSLKCCEANHVYACANVSRMYMRGDGVEKDVTVGKKYREKAEELLKKTREEMQQLKFGE